MNLGSRYLTLLYFTLRYLALVLKVPYFTSLNLSLSFYLFFLSPVGFLKYFKFKTKPLVGLRSYRAGKAAQSTNLHLFHTSIHTLHTILLSFFLSFFLALLSSPPPPHPPLSRLLLPTNTDILLPFHQPKICRIGQESAGSSTGFARYSYVLTSLLGFL